jgi:hypothetical protein
MEDAVAQSKLELLAVITVCPVARDEAEVLYNELTPEQWLQKIEWAKRTPVDGEEKESRLAWAILMVFSHRQVKE